MLSVNAADVRVNHLVAIWHHLTCTETDDTVVRSEEVLTQSDYPGTSDTARCRPVLSDTFECHLALPDAGLSPSDTL